MFQTNIQGNMNYTICFPVSYTIKQASLFIFCILSALIHNNWQGTFQILALINALVLNCQFHARPIYKQA